MDSFRCNRSGLALLIAVLFLATACGGEEKASPLYVDLPEATGEASGLTTTTASGIETTASSAPQGVSVPQATFDEVVSFYDEYLRLRANAIDRTDPIEVIDAVTTPMGRAEVVEALAYNDGLWDDERLSAVAELYLWSNVEDVRQLDDDTIMLIDCTEQQEINAIDQHLIFWPTAEVRINVSDGEMRVESFTMTHNGYLEVGAPLGCAPTSFRERAEATAALVWTDLAVWGQNPDARSDASLSEVVGEPLRATVLEAATESLEGFAIDEHVENSQFTAVGLDSHGRIGAAGAEAIIVQVESCHRFPEGRSGFDPVTQTTVQDLRPGAEQALRFHVLIDADLDADRLDQVVAIDFLSDRCLS